MLVCCRALGARAQFADDGDFITSGEQTGIFPNFPFRDCATRNGAYRFAQEVTSYGGGKYCFTIRVQPPQSCSNACCNTDLYKIEVRGRS